MPLTPQDQQAIVDTHNTYRSDPAVKTPNLQWDSTLATGAQTWADNLAATKTFDHSPDAKNGTVGENIAKGSTRSQTPAKMADGWGTQEKPYFKPGIMPNVTTDSSKVVTHYTQVISRLTTKVGCGLASDGTNDYLVCRYDPPGNLDGAGYPSPQPVTLAQVSVADATHAFGVDAANNVYWYNSNDGTNWTPQLSITGQQMKLVSIASDYTVCGLDSNGAIWQYSINNSTWTQMAAGPVAFKHLSCGAVNNIWAVGTDNQYYQNTGSGWTKGAPGYGIQISVASDGTVVGLGTNNGLYLMPAGGNDWSVVDNYWTFAQPSCGSATNLWAVDRAGRYYKYTGVGSSRTEMTPGTTGKQVSVASDGTVWAIGTDNKVSRLVNNAWTPLLV